ncbi:MAG: peptide permease [Alkaliphilus sp.]|nr:MAG: peptide permease [Alkaliphilus sp.]
MRKYIIRRLLLIIPVLLGISIIIFSLIHAMPGDPFAHLIDPNMTPEDKDRMLESVGYFDPLPVQYLRWVVGAVQGEFGHSIRFKEDVLKVMWPRIQNTFVLSLSAMIFSTLLAIPLGIISSTKQYSVFDYVATIAAFIGLSIPVFFFGLMLIKFVAFDLGLFPIAGMQTIASGYTGWQLFIDKARHLVLPTLVLGLASTASLMRYTRSSMLECVKQDYIRTARAKGLSERVVIYKHALRNALIPVITVLSMQIPRLISGALLTETIFVWPGLARLSFQAIMNRDYPMIMGTVTVMSIVVMLSNLFADLMYAVLDPRIRYQ